MVSRSRHARLHSSGGREYCLPSCVCTEAPQLFHTRPGLKTKKPFATLTSYLHYIEEFKKGSAMLQVLRATFVENTSCQNLILSLFALIDRLGSCLISQATTATRIYPLDNEMQQSTGWQV
jgi:hypothetical protein